MSENMELNIDLDILEVEPAAEYHAKADRFLSSHQLLDFMKCPWLHRKKSIGLMGDNDSASYLIGRAAHVRILEGREAYEAAFALGGPINLQKNATLAAREQQRADERKMAEQMHNDEMARIGQESIDKEKALDDEYNQKMKESQDELDATKKEWQDAIAKAHAEKKMKDAQGPDRLEAPPAIPDYLEGLGPTIEQAQKKTIGVHGTFNAMEAPGMRAGGATDRLTKAAEETAKNTKKLVEQGEQDEQEFD